MARLVNLLRAARSSNLGLKGFFHYLQILEESPKPESLTVKDISLIEQDTGTRERR